MIYGLIGVLLGVILAGLYAYERQSKIYGQMVGILERDRAEARKEAQAFRNLMFPALGKVERGEMSAEISPPQNADRGSRIAAAPPPMNPLQNKRIPFRVRFKKGVQMFDTKGTVRAAMTQAVQKQIDAIQEKKNA